MAAEEQIHMGGFLQSDCAWVGSIDWVDPMLYEYI
jgi:hypothetical protein